MNVLPSASSHNEAQPLYPTHELTQLNAEDFRLKKISDLLKELSDEAEHYRQVAKKYKRNHSIVHRVAAGLGSLSVVLSSGALAVALTGVGIVASPRAWWGCWGLRDYLSFRCGRKQEFES